MSKVVLMKSWWLNIGDGFVKLGAEHILQDIFGEENVVTCSAMGANKFDVIGEGAADADFPSLIDLLTDQVEYVVVAGCVLTDKLARIADKLDHLPSKPKVILLGAGGRGYDEQTVQTVRAILKRLDPFLLVARDNESLKHYGDLCAHARKGFDCAYWVSDAVSSAKSNVDYTVRTFNRMDDPGPSEGKVIRCEHLPLRMAAEQRVRSILRNVYRIFRPSKKSLNVNYFLSDSVAEYLKVYSCAREVHTDMVHATVASVSYGVPVRMYYRSGRQGVLTSVLGDDIFNSVYQVDAEELRERKKSELDAIRAVVS